MERAVVITRIAPELRSGRQPLPIVVSLGSLPIGCSKREPRH